MAFLIEKFWLPLVIAALLGLLVGSATCGRRNGNHVWNWLPLAAIAAVIGLLLATQTALLGRAGLWLETALLMFALYMAGCCLGCFLHDLMVGPIAGHVVDKTDYTMKVAGLSLADQPATAGSAAPFATAPDASGLLRRTYALRSSATDYTAMVAGLGTTAAATIAADRNPALEAEATRRRALAAAPDSYTLPVAGINTLAGRTGVDSVKGNVAAAAGSPVLPAAAGHGAAHAHVAAPIGATVGAIAGMATVAATTGAALTGTTAAKAAAPPSATPTMLPAEPATTGKPLLLARPRDGKKDDLSLIWGVAEKLEEKMNHMGIWHFDQIAAWTPDHVAWFEAEVEGFKGRIDRDKWIEQCRKLSTGWRPGTNIGERPKG
jgi:predicted flap endonuclease-1-like 5' DNA nuclease